MTVVGSVEYDVLGVIDPGKFDKSIDTPLNRAAARAGDRFGTVLGKAIGLAARPFAGRVGDDIGEELTARGRAHGLSFGRLVGAGLTAGLGVQSVGAAVSLLTRGIEASVDAAGELDTAIARSGRTFGAATAEVQAFTSNTQRNLLQSKQDALSAADAFGLLFRGGGVDQSKAAELSVRLTGIAQNLSALHHVPVADVLSALREGVQGNVEPLRDLGINLDAARVKAQAYAVGLARPVRDAPAIGRAQTAVAAATANLAKVQREHGTGTLAAAEAQDRLSRSQEGLARAAAGTTVPLSANQSLLARTSLILRDTESTTGAAARSTGDYAVASQHLRAQLGNVSAELGTKLLPYVIDGERKFSALIDQFHRGEGAGGQLKTSLETAGKSVHQLGEVFDFLRDRTQEGVYGFAVATRGILDVVGVVATVSDKIFHTHFHDSVDDAITKMRDLQGEIERSRAGATIPITVVVTTKAANGNPALHAKGFIGPTVAEGLAASGVAGPYTPAQTGATAVAKAAADARAEEKARSDAAAAKAAQDAQYKADQYAAFQERQRAAIQAAEDAARAQGEAVTKGLQAQMDALKSAQSKLEEQERKILDFRASVIGQARQFTSLTSLASDPSRATAGGIVGSLQSRVLAETLFQKNLTTLASRHLDKGVLAELAQAGPEQRAFASALAQGTDAQITALNAAERASRARAASLATTATDQQFGGGAFGKLARQVAGLEAQQRRTNKLLEAQPALIGKAVDQAGKNAKVAQASGTRTAVAR